MQWCSIFGIYVTYRSVLIISLQHNSNNISPIHTKTTSNSHFTEIKLKSNVFTQPIFCQYYVLWCNLKWRMWTRANLKIKGWYWQIVTNQKKKNFKTNLTSLLTFHIPNKYSYLSNFFTSTLMTKYSFPQIVNRTVCNGRKAASYGSVGYSHHQQMVSTASPPKGNSKIELVKSVTIHGGKCLAVPANANESHVRSKIE